MGHVDRLDPSLKHTPAGFPKGYRVTCKRCSFYTDVNIGNISGGMPPDQVARKVRQRGWEVGRSFADVLCAKCVEAQAPAKRPKLAVVPAVVADPALVIPTFTPEEPMSTPHAALPLTPIAGRAEPPRSMTKADRQIIFTLLQDAYPKTDAGYVKGWTDEKVARDLGVPRAWVSLIRDENFGPQILGPSVDEQFEAYRKQTATELLGIKDRLAELQGTINTASSVAASMAAVVAAMEKRVGGKS